MPALRLIPVYQGLARDFPAQVAAPPRKPGKDASPEQTARWEHQRHRQSPGADLHRARHRRTQAVADTAALDRTPRPLPADRPHRRRPGLRPRRHTVITSGPARQPAQPGPNRAPTRYHLRRADRDDRRGRSRRPSRSVRPGTASPACKPGGSLWGRTGPAAACACWWLPVRASVSPGQRLCGWLHGRRRGPW